MFNDIVNMFVISFSSVLYCFLMCCCVKCILGCTEMMITISNQTPVAVSTLYIIL